MRTLFTICAICCFIAVFNLPISYYKFLRILVSIGSIAMIYNLLLLKSKNYAWVLIFAIILIFFNPIAPIYLHRKTIWMPLDIITGILFLVFAFIKKKEIISNAKIIEPINTKKPYTRDRIILSKNSTLKNN